MVELHGLRATGSLVARGGGLDPPLSVVASWPRPNSIDPESHTSAWLVLLMITLAIAFLVFLARMWARVIVAKNAGLDDIIIAMAMVPLFGLSLATWFGCREYGFQWHIWDQTLRTLVTVRQVTLAIEILYMTSTTLIKVSILCFYRRITNGAISNTFKYIIWAFIAFVTIYGIAFTLIVTFGCTPVEGFWRRFDFAWRLENEVECINEGAITVAIVVINTLQDFFICAFPITILWNLQMPKRQKAALMGVLGVGVLTCICGIMRSYYAVVIYYYTYDTTWYGFYGWVCTSIEANLGVVCASAPALKIFARRYFGSASTARSSYTNYLARKNVGRGSLPVSLGSANSTWKPPSVPLNHITVHTGMDISIKRRDEIMSLKSNSSTKDVSALPWPIPKSKLASEEWGPFRTLCEGPKCPITSAGKRTGGGN